MAGQRSDGASRQAPLIELTTQTLQRDRATLGQLLLANGAPQKLGRTRCGQPPVAMESNRVRTDKASGIRNDPNDWSIEHDDPTYILDLVGRVVTVSMRTLEIIDSLPRLRL